MTASAQIRLVQNDETSEDDSGIKPLSGEVFGALINLSGRRRFTSQRLVLYAVLASQGHDGAVKTAREALALFRGAHTALVKGSDTVPGIFCEEVREAYFGKLDGDAQIVYFMNLAERALNAIEDRLRDGPALLDELVRITTPLLSVLNQITSVYEEQSKRHAVLMSLRASEAMISRSSAGLTIRHPGLAGGEALAAQEPGSL